MPIITAQGIVETYGSVRALDGLDLGVEEGTVLGLLGPNGAGRTTAVRVLTTLLLPTAGAATVAGLDVVRDAKALRARIGVSGQCAVRQHPAGQPAAHGLAAAAPGARHRRLGPGAARGLRAADRAPVPARRVPLT